MAPKKVDKGKGKAKVTSSDEETIEEQPRRRVSLRVRNRQQGSGRPAEGSEEQSGAKTPVTAELEAAQEVVDVPTPEGWHFHKHIDMREWPFKIDPLFPRMSVEEADNEFRRREEELYERHVVLRAETGRPNVDKWTTLVTEIQDFELQTRREMRRLAHEQETKPKDQQNWSKAYDMRVGALLLCHAWGKAWESMAKRDILHDLPQEVLNDIVTTAHQIRCDLLAAGPPFLLPKRAFFTGPDDDDDLLRPSSKEQVEAMLGEKFAHHSARHYAKLRRWGEIASQRSSEVSRPNALSPDGDVIEQIVGTHIDDYSDGTSSSSSSSSPNPRPDLGVAAPVKRPASRSPGDSSDSHEIGPHVEEWVTKVSLSKRRKSGPST